MEENKTKVKDAFKYFSSIGIEKVMEYDKNDELKGIIENKTLDDMIYNFDTEEGWKETNNITPKLIFCEKKVDLLTWTYYRKRVSKLRYSSGPGRNIKILVQDTYTKKYIGIIELSSDIIALKERDTYIGWSNEIKKKKINNIMNISCCVPLQPFGFNTNGGKLLTSLCFSQEVYNYYYKKYNTPLVALITTSIHGKSIQYDRLPFLKFIGYTSGAGSIQFPNELYKLAVEYCNVNKIDLNCSLSSGKLKRIELILKHLDLPKNLLYHFSKRGIYFGYLNQSSKSFLLGETEIFNVGNVGNVKQISSWWKERWLNNRIKNVKISFNKKLYIFNEDLQQEYISFLPKLQLEDLSLKEKRKLYMQEYRNKNRDISFKMDDDSYLKFGYTDIYKVICNITGKCYIGKAVHVLNKKNPQKHGAMGRWKRHQNANSKCSILYNAINKYGAENFTIEVLCVCKTENENQLEKMMIKEYNTIYPEGLNILQGGEGNYSKSGQEHQFYGKTFSDEYRKKLSDSHSGENNHFYGKHFSETHRKNLSHGISVAKREYDDQIFIEILKEKCSFDTIEEITKKIQSKFNLKIDRNGISKIWNGIIKPINLDICNTEQYKNFISFQRKKIHKRKWTDSEIDFILTLQSSEVKSKMSSIKAVKIFEEKFNKKITTGSIHDIWSGKIKPMYKIRESAPELIAQAYTINTIDTVGGQGSVPNKKTLVESSNINNNVRPQIERPLCKKENCKFKEKESGYCGKHSRQYFIDLAIAEGKELCDPARGCFKYLEEGRRKCEDCRKKVYEQERARIEKRRQENEKVIDSNYRICFSCGIQFEKFLTLHNLPSTKCKNCYEKQQKYEKVRCLIRTRDYTQEKFDNLDTAYNSFVRSAKKRNIENYLTKDNYIALVLANCKYCDCEKSAGIDRIDNNKGYLLDNCVSCCGTCNRIKHILHPLFFMEKCELITYCTTNINSQKANVFYENWPEYIKKQQNVVSFQYIKRNAKKRNLEFSLSKEIYTNLCKGTCYLCGVNNMILGIDRKDPTKGYTIENSFSCCATCNMMKHSLKLEEFLNHISKFKKENLDTDFLQKIECIKKERYQMGGAKN